MQLKNIAYRTFSVFLCFAIANIGVPESPLVAIGKPIKDAISSRLAADAQARREVAQRRAASATRLLSDKEVNTLQGRTAQCPYVAGASKWDPSFQGVDMITGNFSTSATDLSFDGGYGIPVNITRSYSSNDANEGPFGRGWTLSADVRTTAGGILKRKAAAVRSVPTTCKERSPLETDPNVTAQPVDAVTAEDASGKQETIQKDADGVLSPAAWDQNQTVSQYTSVIQGGFVYQVMSSQTTTTPEGTTYVYKAEGSYINGGTYPFSDPTASPTPANVLKCVSATDRNGNTTTYTYGSGLVTFNKIDGVTQELPLISVQMPNGHKITLTWGSGATSNRVVSVSDNNNARVVNYAYDSSGDLCGVTSPAGLTTTYGYGTAYNALNDDVSYNILTSVTDPRGLSTQIAYFVGIGYVAPYGNAVESVIVDQITEPNGITDDFYWLNNADYNPQTGGFLSPGYVGSYQRYAPGNTIPITQYYVAAYPNGNNLEIQQFINTATKPAGPPIQDDNYDIFSQNNTSSTSTSTPYNYQTFGWYSVLPNARLLGASAFNYESSSTSTAYNFQGKPLDCKATETEYLYGSGTVVTPRVATTSYAYWDASKYYQQKAVKDAGGRISFTDYYPSSDPNLGNRGQKCQVFDPKYGGIGLNTSITPPSGTQAQDAWRYQVNPIPGQYSAQFAYDAKGRTTTVCKLQSGTPGTPSTYQYVTTQATYGADSDGSWGQAALVVEDSGGINRTTRTLAYTSWGKADDVIDPAGNEFVTTFDGDGKVLSVTQPGVGPLVTYSYGNSGVSNGQVVAVTDNLSNVSQELTYQATAGGGIGQIQAVTEIRNGQTDNILSYSYNGLGSRSLATYRDGSNNLLAQWGYYDYLAVGLNGNFAFQTLCKLDGNGNRTSEEFHYAYDSQGRLIESAFAQTPSTTTPDASGYYDGHLAQSRARAHYEYDAGGRLYWVAHYWDTLNSSGNAYNSEAILGNGADFEENSGLNRGIKLDNKYYTRTTAGQPNWTLSQTDTYTYDPQFDCLTGASYGDGQPNASQTWSYDAAGNRNDAVTDNLNRATSLGGVSVTNDILGNRLTSGSNSYGWDQLSRMTSFGNGSLSTAYVYRADGMRIYKSNANGSTSYRYDGQTGIEDVEYVGGHVQKVTDYGIGARGIDAMYVTQGGSTTSAYPLYDTHGNMISALSRQGTGGYQFSAPRTYDAWGQIRLGASTGDPKGRYCASLGHKQDDESGLVYMRARYYEPTSGRFLAEDMDRQSRNYFTYCSGDPINFSDRSGKDTNIATDGVLFETLGLFLASIAMAMAASKLPGALLVAQIACLMIAGGSAAIVFRKNEDGNNFLKSGVLGVAGGLIMVYWPDQLVKEFIESESVAAVGENGVGSIAAQAFLCCGIYSMTCVAFIVSIDGT